jgi:hypothetical protein
MCRWPGHDAATVRRTDLSHTDLSHTDLSHTDLSHTDLGHTDLGHTDLGWTALTVYPRRALVAGRRRDQRPARFTITRGFSPTASSSDWCRLASHRRIWARTGDRPHLRAVTDGRIIARFPRIHMPGTARDHQDWRIRPDPLPFGLSVAGSPIRAAPVGASRSGHRRLVEGRMAAAAVHMPTLQISHVN